jgi:hypothetical protein
LAERRGWREFVAWRRPSKKFWLVLGTVWVLTGTLAWVLAEFVLDSGKPTGVLQALQSLPLYFLFGPVLIVGLIFGMIVTALNL